MNLKTKTEFDNSIKELELQFVDLIRHRLGIVMHSHQNYELFRTIQEGCAKFNLTPIEYLKEVKNSPNQSPLLDHLIAGITVGETYFFRDQQQMLLLQNYVLPKIIANKRDKSFLSFRIWSAGCATGEEIYSIGMMLYEILPDIEKWNIKLLATDVNTAILQKGILGAYTEWSMRAISDYYKQKYFQKEGKHYLLAQKIKEMVNFEYLNLNDDSYPSIFNETNAQDLIICRNVLIYIDSESCGRLMQKINKCLVPDGYLMLGASDPINIAGTDFVYENRKGTLFSRILTKNSYIDFLIDQPIKTITEKSTEKKDTSLSKYISKYISKSKTKSKSTKTLSQDLLLKATELANMGKLEEATKLCEKGFKLDPTNKIHYFTYGLAMSELNKLTEAESALRKTLFLDNQFVAGHFQLGLLLIRNKQHDAGIKSLRNALVIAESKLSDEIVPGSPGLNYKEFAEILRNEIKLYITSET